MSFLLISVANRLGCESVNVDKILTYKKIFVLALRTYLPPLFWGKANNFRWLFEFLPYYVATIKRAYIETFP